MKKLNGWWIVALSVVTASPALAQVTTQYVPDTEIEVAPDEERRGFDGALSIGANFNLVSNSSVVGQVDGFSTLFGLSLTGGLDYLYGKHEWRNTLRINESWARTPVIDEFVKNNDIVELESLYNYFFASWVGAFGRFNVDTALLTTEAVTSDVTEYAIARTDGSTETITTDRFHLADAFQPLTLAESIGLFAEPISQPAIRASVRAGAGARQTLAEGVRVIKDDDATDAVEVTELADVFQAGLELFAGAQGRFAEDRLRYEVGAAVLVPFLNNDPQDRGAFDLTRVGLTGQISTSVFTWMSLNYQFRMVRDPQLVDAVQIQNALLLTFQVDLVERDSGTPGPTTEDLLREAQQKLEQAEQECADAMAEARKAQQRAIDAETEAREARERAAEEEARRRAAEQEQQAPETDVAPETDAAPGADEAPQAP